MTAAAPSAATGRSILSAVACLLASLASEADAVLLHTLPAFPLALNVTVNFTEAAEWGKPGGRPRPPLVNESGEEEPTQVHVVREATHDCTASKPCSSWRSTWQGLLVFSGFLSVWWWLTASRPPPPWHTEARLLLEDEEGAAAQRQLRICAVSWKLGTSRPSTGLSGSGPLLAECVQLGTRGVGAAGSSPSPAAGAADVYAVCLQDSSTELLDEAEQCLERLLGSAYRLVLREQGDERAAAGVLVFAADTVRAQPLQGQQVLQEHAQLGTVLSFVSANASRRPRGKGAPAQELLRHLHPRADDLSLLMVMGARGEESDSEFAGGMDSGGDDGEVLYRAGPGAEASLLECRACGAEEEQPAQARSLPTSALLELRCETRGPG